MSFHRGGQASMWWVTLQEKQTKTNMAPTSKLRRIQQTSTVSLLYGFLSIIETMYTQHVKLESNYYTLNIMTILVPKFNNYNNISKFIGWFWCSKFQILEIPQFELHIMRSLFADLRKFNWHKSFI